MACRLMAFDREGWVPGGHPLEKKKGPFGNAVLIEFAPGFHDPSWCRRSHVIYVVSGRLDIELEDRTESALAGQAVALDRDTPHRARNDGDVPAVLFIVSDV